MGQISTDIVSCVADSGALNSPAMAGSDGQAVKVETDEEKDDDADGFSVAGQGLSQAHACRADEDVEISGQGNTVTLTQAA